MTDFEVDLSTVERTGVHRRPPYLGTLCTNPQRCETCAEVRRLIRENQPSEANQMRRVPRIFVNAIDVREVSLGFPVRIFMLPKTVFLDFIAQVRHVHEETANANIFHPETGSDLIVQKEGEGLRTAYHTAIVPTISKVPNISLYDSLMAGDKTYLYPLDRLYHYFNEHGTLLNGTPIVRLESGRNQIRILPPYDDTRQIHAELGFHYFTINDQRTTGEVDYDPLPPYNTQGARTERTRSRGPIQPRQGRELMLPQDNDIEPELDNERAYPDYDDDEIPF